MLHSQSKSLHSNGFMALVAVIILATGALAFSLLTLSIAADYSDSVSRHELRIQAGLNSEACVATIELMYEKDYFLNGEVTLPEFGCRARISNDMNGSAFISIVAVLEGVGAQINRALHFNNL